jgi:3-hydroxyisobutyrate dehydrogenase-like beta-hydroxyacid dehydrogenase
VSAAAGSGTTVPGRSIGMIGLGLLGSALAERFLGAGFHVIGFDIDAQRCEQLTQLGGRAAASALAVARQGQLVFSLPTSDIVAGVLDEIAAALPPGCLIVDTTTGEPERSAALGAQLAARGIAYVDATVVGSSAQVSNRDVIVMAGGRPDDFADCAAIFSCFARQAFHVGPWGAGARLKLVVNLVLGLNRAVLAEGLAFARTCGIDAGQALEVLRAGAAYSRVMDTKGRKMIEEDFACQARLAQHLKDVRLIRAEGRRIGARLPLSDVHEQLLEKLLDAGLGDVDNAAIIKAFAPGP